MTNKVNVLRCPVGLVPEVVMVETFDDLRHHCGDENNRMPYITRVRIAVGGTPFDVWCDEDGEPKGLPLNQPIVTGHSRCRILGTFVVTARHTNEAIVGLEDAQITMLKTELERWRR